MIYSIIFITFFIPSFTLGDTYTAEKVRAAFTQWNGKDPATLIKKIKQINPDKGVIESIREMAKNSSASEYTMVEHKIYKYQSKIRDTLRDTRQRYIKEYTKANPAKANTLYGFGDIGSWTTGEKIGEAADFDWSMFGVDKEVALEVAKGWERELAKEVGLDANADLLKELDVVVTPEGYEEASGVYGNKESKDWASRNFKNFDLITCDPLTHEATISHYEGESAVSERAQAQRMAKIRTVMSEAKYGNAEVLLFDLRGNFHPEMMDKLNPEAQQALRKLLGELGMFKANETTASGGIIEMAAHLHHEVLQNKDKMTAEALLDKINKYASRSETMAHLGKLSQEYIDKDPLLNKDPAMKKAYEFLLENQGLRKEELVKAYGDKLDHTEISELGANIEKVLKRLALLQFQHQIEKVLTTKDPGIRSEKLLEMKNAFDAELPKEIYPEFHKEVATTLEVTEEISSNNESIKYIQETIESQKKLETIKKKNPSTIEKFNQFLEKTIAGKKVRSLETASNVEITDDYGAKAYETPTLEWLKKMNKVEIIVELPEALQTGSKVVHYMGTAALLVSGIEAIRNSETDAQMAMALGNIWATNTFYGMIASETYHGVSQGDPKKLAKAIMFMLVPAASIPDLMQSLGMTVGKIAKELYFEDTLNTLYVLSNYFDDNQKGDQDSCNNALQIDDQTPTQIVELLLTPGMHRELMELHQIAAQKVSKEKLQQKIPLAEVSVVESALNNLYYRGETTLFTSYGPLMEVVLTVKQYNDQIKELSETFGAGDIPTDVDAGWLDESIATKRDISPGTKQAIRKLMLQRDKERNKIKQALAQAISQTFKERCMADKETGKGKDNALKLLDETLKTLDTLLVKEPCQQALEQAGKYNRIKYLFSTDKEVQRKAMTAVLKYKNAYSYIAALKELLNEKYSQAIGRYPVPTPMSGWPQLVCEPGYDAANAKILVDSTMQSIEDIGELLKPKKTVKNSKKYKECRETAFRVMLESKYRLTYYDLLKKNYNWLKENKLYWFEVFDKNTLNNEIETQYKKIHSANDRYMDALKEYRSCVSETEKDDDKKDKDKDKTEKTSKEISDQEKILDNTRSSNETEEKSQDSKVIKSKEEGKDTTTKDNKKSQEDATDKQKLAQQQWEWFKKDVRRYLNELMNASEAEYSTIENKVNQAIMAKHGTQEDADKCLKDAKKASKALRKEIGEAQKEHSEVLNKLHEDQGSPTKILEHIDTFVKKYHIPKDLKVSVTYTSTCVDGSNKEDTEQLKVVISGSKNRVINAGETLSLNANTSGGKAPISLQWQGDNISPSGATAVFAASTQGSYTVQVTAKDGNGAMVTDAVTIKVKKLIEPALTGLDDVVYYGTTQTIEVETDDSIKRPEKSGKIDCKKNPNNPFCVSTKPCKNPFDPDCTVKISEDNYGSPAGFSTLPADDTEVNLPSDTKEGEYEYIWQPSGNSGLEFDPPSGKKPQVKVTFGNIGEIEIWAEVLKDGEKVGETKRIQTKVIPPKFTLKVSPETGYMGQEHKATINISPDIDNKYLNFRWIPMGDNVQELGETNEGRGYRFRTKNVKASTIEVLVWAVPYAQEQIADLKQVVSAKSYDVSVSKPKRLDKAPWIWDAKKGEAVEQPLAIAVFQNAEVHATITPTPQEKLSYSWNVTPEGCTISAPFSQSTYLNAYEKNSYQYCVKVTNKDGFEIGKACDSLTITVSQKELDAAKEKQKDQEKANKLLQEAKKLWQEGNLQQAITKVMQAAKLHKADKEIDTALKSMQNDKKVIDEKLDSAKQAIQKTDLDNAKKLLDGAQAISSKYEKYQQVRKAYEEALKKATLREAVEESSKQGKQLWQEGKLEEAIAKFKDAAQMDPSNKEVNAALESMQQQKKEIDEKVANASKEIDNSNIEEAAAKLKEASTISKNYPSYIEMTQKLKDAQEAERKKALEEKIIAIKKKAEETEEKNRQEALAQKIKEAAENRVKEQKKKKLAEKLKEIERKAKIRKDQAEKEKEEQKKKELAEKIKEIQSQAETGKENVTGKWILDGSNAVFTHSGNTITGSYDYSNGSLHGTIQGKIWNGVWTQNKSMKRCAISKYGSFYWGQFHLIFNSTFNKFSGEWSYCDNIPDQRKWKGEKIGDKQSKTKANTSHTPNITDHSSDRAEEKKQKELAEKIKEIQRKAEIRKEKANKDALAKKIQAIKEAAALKEAQSKKEQENSNDATREPSVQDKQYVQGFAGNWKSTYGVMELNVEGLRVTGKYTHDKGRIEAQLSRDGTTMKGTWSESPSYKPPRDAGKMYFKLTDNGNKIDGTWGYGNEVPEQTWIATRIKSIGSITSTSSTLDTSSIDGIVSIDKSQTLQPKKIVTSSTFEMPSGSGYTVKTKATITFWNLGAKVSGYGDATMDVRSVSSRDGSVQTMHYTGTFSGGPNGVMKVSDGHVKVTLKVIDGKRVKVDRQKVYFDIPDPSVFK